MVTVNHIRASLVACLALCLIATALLSPVFGDSQGQQIRELTVADGITRLVYPDGNEEWTVAGWDNKLKLIQPMPQIREEPKPGARDIRRGYVAFSPQDKGGVLPEYIPSADEIKDEVSIFASPDEYEPATFAIRPLKDLGAVKFTCDELIGPEGAKISGSSVDVCIVEPTLEPTMIEVYRGNEIRWYAKWLRPVNSAKAFAFRNLQAYLDIRVPEDAKPGLYSGKVAIDPEKGARSFFTLHLEVLPLKLSRPMSWGLFPYDWEKPAERAESILWQLIQMRRAGMTQCVISPFYYEERPGINKDGSVDLSIYDQCIELYRKAGFEDPPIVAMIGLMYGIAEVTGKLDELGFKRFAYTGDKSSVVFIDQVVQSFELGINAEDVPDDVRELTRKVIRSIYDHSLEAKWPDFYLYTVDEPHPVQRMEQAEFMFGAASDAAPEMRIASTIYTHSWWKSLSGMVDLNIAHYVHPCNNADANRRWRDLARRQQSKLYGIDFLNNDIMQGTYWTLRRITLTAEKAGLDGMMCWSWPICIDIDGSFNPYWSLGRSSDKATSPFYMRGPDGRAWLSFPWIGIREGIDDSRYVQTLKKAIADAEAAGRHDAARIARMRLERAMNEVPWVPGVRASGSNWNPAGADRVRRELADAAVECRSKDFALYHNHDVHPTQLHP